MELAEEDKEEKVRLITLAKSMREKENKENEDCQLFLEAINFSRVTPLKTSVTKTEQLKQSRNLKIKTKKFPSTYL